MPDIHDILPIGRCRRWPYSLMPVFVELSKNALKIVERAKCFPDLNDTIAALADPMFTYVATI
jgi:hypothetical protein